MGKNCWEEFPETVGTTFDQELHRALAEQRTVEFESYSPPTDRWVGVHVYPSEEGLSVYVQDITERKKAEEQLAYHTYLLENTEDAVLASDEHAVLTVWNKGAEQMFGWTAEEVLGRKVYDVLPYGEYSDEQLAEALRRLAEMGRRRTEATWYRKDGAPVYAEALTIALRGKQGPITGYLSIIRDLSERKRAEQVRQRLLEQLITAQEDERGRLARELHDSLGQSLTALHFGLKMVQGRANCPPDVAEAIEKLRELALRIDDDLDRLTFDLRPPALDDLGLAEALRLLVKEWSATSHIPVDLHTSHLDHERPPATLETTIYRIVQEALTNVLKHAQATRVSLVVERRGGQVRAIIEDDGRGFDRTAMEERSGAGHRLGLKDMEERAALVNGRLHIETSLGAGTTIYIHIPLRPEEGEGGSAAHDRSK